MSLTNKWAVVCSALTVLASAQPAGAYDAETHALIAYRAYGRSALSQTGAGSLVATLGLDRLDIPTPFNTYWQATGSTPGPVSYYDNTVTFAPSTYARQPNFYEQCQMQHLADTVVDPASNANWLSGDPMLSGNKVTFFPIENWLMRGDLREDDLSWLLYNSIAKDRCGQPDSDPYGQIVRVFNHFYDPIHDVGLNIGAKSVDWALGYIDSFATPPVVDTNRRNHFTYADARENMWLALTGERGRSSPPYTAAARAADAQERLFRWATTFRSLGDAIHLLQDGASPQHVRNDPHSPVGTSQEQQAFEGYTNARVLNQTVGDSNAYVRGFFRRPDYGKGLPPIVLGSTPYPVPVFATPLRFYTTRLKGNGPADLPDGRYGMMDYANRSFFTGGTLPNMSANAFQRPMTPVDAAHGYTQSQVPCVLSAAQGNTWRHDLKCAHWMHAVPDSVATGYVDTLPSVEGVTQFTQPPLAAFSAFTIAGCPPAQCRYTVGLEELQNMANLAIPRAIGYSAGLINYFFRGQITVTSSPGGLFGVLDQGTPHTVDADGYPRKTDNTIFGFTTVRARVKNTTADIHESGSGTVVPQVAQSGQLVAIARYHRNPCYRPDLSGEYVKKPDGSFTVPAGCSVAQTRTAYQEISVAAPLAIDANGNLSGTSNGTNPCANVGNLTTGAVGTCANSGGVLGEFDFSSDPIPANATDLFVQVAYRGGLGQETGAIAVGMIDLREPNYYTTWDNSDWFLYNGQWADPAVVAPQVPVSTVPIPITDIVMCWEDQRVFDFATTNAVGPGQFFRFGILTDLQPHTYALDAHFNGTELAGRGSPFVGMARQSDKENGGTFAPDPMIYGRGTTLGTVGWFAFYLYSPTSTAPPPAGTNGIFRLAPPLSGPRGPGLPVSGTVHYTSLPDAPCTELSNPPVPSDTDHAAVEVGAPK
ncbi:MAG: hypothetical protein ABIO49_14130 [Dokdonella sp.]